MPSCVMSRTGFPGVCSQVAFEMLPMSARTTTCPDSLRCASLIEPTRLPLAKSGAGVFSAPMSCNPAAGSYSQIPLLSSTPGSSAFASNSTWPRLFNSMVDQK